MTSITNKDLKNDLDTINRVSRKKYVIDGNISGWCLRDSISNTSITGFLSKRELHDSIWCIVKHQWNESK